MGDAVLGIDVGGTGIKAGAVDILRGRLVGDRLRIQTPRPADPKNVARVVHRVASDVAALHRLAPPVGCTFPGAVVDGIVRTAPNLSAAWVGASAAAVLGEAVGAPVTVLNDADAAGLAEVAFGAGRGQMGVVVMLTLGTGIGSAVFLHGQLLPNTEFGHIELQGRDAEQLASDRARQRKRLSWKRWARRLSDYLQHLEGLVYPDLFILGGGVSADAAHFIPRLTTRAPVVPARLGNTAGIIGAALAAAPPARRPPRQRLS